MWLLVLSAMLELGMLTLAIYAPIMASRSNDCITDIDIKLVVYILTVVMFLRVF